MMAPSKTSGAKLSVDNGRAYRYIIFVRRGPCVLRHFCSMMLKRHLQVPLYQSTSTSQPTALCTNTVILLWNIWTGFSNGRGGKMRYLKVCFTLFNYCCFDTKSFSRRWTIIASRMCTKCSGAKERGRRNPHRLISSIMTMKCGQARPTTYPK